MKPKTYLITSVSLFQTKEQVGKCMPFCVKCFYKKQHHFLIIHGRRMQDDKNNRLREKSLERSQLPTNFVTVIFCLDSKLVNTCMHCGYCICCAPSLVRWCRCLAAQGFSAFNHSNIGNWDSDLALVPSNLGIKQGCDVNAARKTS